MEAAASLSSSAAACLSSGGSRRCLLPPSRSLIHRRPTTGNKFLIVSNARPHSGHKGNGGSRHRGRRTSPVDEFMPLLHARIREVEAAEKIARRSKDSMAQPLPHQPPAETDELADWERRYHLTGDNHREVLLAVGVLRTLLMDVRPGAVIGALVLLLAGLVTTGIAVFARIAYALVHVTVFPL